MTKQTSTTSQTVSIDLAALTEPQKREVVRAIDVMDTIKLTADGSAIEWVEVPEAHVEASLQKETGWAIGNAIDIADDNAADGEGAEQGRRAATLRRAATALDIPRYLLTTSQVDDSELREAQAAIAALDGKVIIEVGPDDDRDPGMVDERECSVCKSFIGWSSDGHFVQYFTLNGELFCEECEAIDDDSVGGLEAPTEQGTALDHEAGRLAAQSDIENYGAVEAHERFRNGASGDGADHGEAFWFGYRQALVQGMRVIEKSDAELAAKNDPTVRHFTACHDGQIRHGGDHPDGFATLVAASRWADQGHTCLDGHRVLVAASLAEARAMAMAVHCSTLADTIERTGERIEAERHRLVAIVEDKATAMESLAKLSIDTDSMPTVEVFNAHVIAPGDRLWLTSPGAVVEVLEVEARGSDRWIMFAMVEGGEVHSLTVPSGRQVLAVVGDADNRPGVAIDDGHKLVVGDRISVEDSFPYSVEVVREVLAGGDGEVVLHFVGRVSPSRFDELGDVRRLATGRPIVGLAIGVAGELRAVADVESSLTPGFARVTLSPDGNNGPRSFEVVEPTEEIAR